MTAEVGQRVRLLSTDDQYTRLGPGAEGTVVLVDALGTVHVNWDDGSSLGLVPGEDRWEEAHRPLGAYDPETATITLFTDDPDEGEGQ